MDVPYAIPLADISFALTRVVGADDADSPPFDPSVLEQVLGEAGRFAVSRLLPLNLAADQFGARLEKGEVVTAPGLAEAYREWSAGGWMGVSLPEEHGGSGLSPMVTAALDEIWNSANMAFYVCPTLGQAALKLLLTHGSEAQVRSFVPHLVSGEWSASMGLTEPQAGSDLSLATTRAVPAPDGSYRIRGTKVFTSYGEHDWSTNIVNLVIARIDGAPAGSRGLSLFIVPKFLDDGSRNDLACVGVEHKLGLRGSPTCTMVYGENGGATGFLLGPPEAGLATMFVMMNKARIACALQSVGICERALQQAAAYSKERVQGRAGGTTVSIASHPDVQRMLLEIRALTLAARALTYTAVAAVECSGPDESARGALLTPVAKVFASEAACRAANLNIQVHGGMGYVEETGAAQLLRDARAIPIYEGTNGIQGIDFAQRKILADRGEALRAETARIRVYVRDAENAGEAGWDSLGTALDALDQAAGWLLDPARKEEEVLAAASPLIALAGLVLAGGYVLKGLVNARRSQEPVPTDLARAADFYARILLLHAPALAAEVEGSASILA